MRRLRGALYRWTSALAVAAWRLAERVGVPRWRVVDHVFPAVYFTYKRHFEDPFHALGRRSPQLFRNGHILDVGANIGYTATVFERLAAPPYRVLALEPEPVNFRRLEARVRKSAGRITALQCAAGASNGTARLALSRVHPGDHALLHETADAAPDTIAVELITIDTLVQSELAGEPIGFIKVDVQGAELDVCRGMEQTLRDHPGAAVAVEHSAAPGDTQVLDFFRERGYALHHIGRRGDLSPITIEQAAQLAADYGYINVLCTRDSEVL